MNIKFGQLMYLIDSHHCGAIGVDDVIDDIIKSKKTPKIKIAITQLIFELQQNLKN